MSNKFIFALMLICTNAFSAQPNMSFTVNPVSSALGYLNGSFKYRVAEKIAIGVHGEKIIYSPFKNDFLWDGYGFGVSAKFFTGKAFTNGWSIEPMVTFRDMAFAGKEFVYSGKSITPRLIGGYGWNFGGFSLNLGLGISYAIQLKYQAFPESKLQSFGLDGDLSIGWSW